MYVKVSQDSVDTLTRRFHVSVYPGIILVCQSIPGFHGYFIKGVPCLCVSWDNPMYVRILQILYQGAPVTAYPGIILCMSEYPRTVDTLFHVITHVLWDNPTYVAMSQYPRTFQNYSRLATYNINIPG